MSKRRMAAVVLMTAVLIICQIFPIKAADDENLYALSAVLMDGETGRVLYGKEAYKGRPNASTTKVMTCILALELAKGDDYVQVSGNAASQPQTRLGMREGQQFYLEDLLYSLMLKSHNDSAVAIAEHISGSVEAFAEKMNEKAKELGCKDTHFVTPNGLDGEDEGGIHHTTARDLALIMAYAIKNATFVHITQTRDYTFTDISGKKHYSVHNTNAFLDMETGVISGKTGFTGNAGYCYVCACQKDNKTFIIALLGAGWPDHKNYKWHDTLELLNYGNSNYEYRSFWQEPELSYIPVENGILNDFGAGSSVYTGGHISVSDNEKNRQILIGSDDRLQYQIRLKEHLSAPVRRGEQIGQIIYLLNDNNFFSCPILATENIQKNTFTHCAELVFKNFFH